MTEFAPLSLCKKLVALGCKSESMACWVIENYGADKAISYISLSGVVPGAIDGEVVVAFSQNDFTGATEQAVENAKKVWPKISNLSNPRKSKGYMVNAFALQRNAMLYCYKKNELWHQFLERTMIVKDL